MAQSQTAVSRAVKNWMRAAHLTQTDVAHMLGLAPSRISRRLSGHTRWTLDDVDMLVVAGAPLDRISIRDEEE